MQKSLIKYLILPKGMQSIVFKSYSYFVPALYLAMINYHQTNILPSVVLAIVLFELIINPSRYQLNDLRDYKEDQERHHHWKRPVNEENRSLVLSVALGRFILGTFFAFLWNPILGWLAITFLSLQLFYDYYAKRNSAVLAILSVGIAYPLRSLSVFTGTDASLDGISILLLCAVSFYAVYMALQWRKYEALFIARNGLPAKPHSDVFSNSKINFFIYATLLLFLSSSILSTLLILRLDTWHIFTICVATVLLIALFSLPSRYILERTVSQSHNIAIACILIVLSMNRFAIGLVIALAIPFLMFWYHRIYVEKFANNYFNETHHAKK